MRIPFCLALIALTIAVGCETPPAQDPLAGWKSVGAYDSVSAVIDHSSNPVENCPFDPQIIRDYERFVQQYRFQYVEHYEFYQDATGQRAVKIDGGKSNTYITLILIYNRFNQRTRFISYHTGNYSS